MEDKEDRPENNAWKGRGYIILASNEAHERIIDWINQMPDARLIYTKTAHHKRLVLREEGY